MLSLGVAVVTTGRLRIDEDAVTSDDRGLIDASEVDLDSERARESGLRDMDSSKVASILNGGVGNAERDLSRWISLVALGVGLARARRQRQERSSRFQDVGERRRAGVSTVVGVFGVAGRERWVGMLQLETSQEGYVYPLTSQL